MYRTLGMAAFVLCALGLGASGQDKDKKFEVPKNATAGKVKTVDLKANSFTLTLTTGKDSGKDRAFGVDDKTEFWGPKGGDRGTGAKGLKDETMSAGYEIRVTASKDGKTARNVYLPDRKAEEKKK